MAALKSGEQAAVHGAMRVLTEFSRDLTDQHIPQVAPVILPEMYRIFCEDQVSRAFVTILIPEEESSFGEILAHVAIQQGQFCVKTTFKIIKEYLLIVNSMYVAIYHF